jgi:UDP-N-acetyl-D-glucosamine/UDP-N-acetyl-D-galactosamine dehydrogenase
LRRGIDRTCELNGDQIIRSGLRITDKPADFFVVTEPTPIDESHAPDLSTLLPASRIVGGALAPGSIVVYETTTYSGATEKECVLVLRKR